MRSIHPFYFLWGSWKWIIWNRFFVSWICFAHVCHPPLRNSPDERKLSTSYWVHPACLPPAWTWVHSDNWNSNFLVGPTMATKTDSQLTRQVRSSIFIPVRFSPPPWLQSCLQGCAFCAEQVTYGHRNKSLHTFRQCRFFTFEFKMPHHLYYHWFVPEPLEKKRRSTRGCYTLKRPLWNISFFLFHKHWP